MTLVKSTDTTECKTDEDICSLPKEDPDFNGDIGIVAVTHYSIGSCVSWGCGEIAIQSWYMNVNADVYWRTSYDDSGGNFARSMSHEFGHVLALGHNFSEYNAIQMSYGAHRIPAPGFNIRTVTEDDCFGLAYVHGRDNEPIRFKSAKLGEAGLSDFSLSEQQALDYAHESLGIPAIAINPDVSTARAFDFAVAWTRAGDRAVGYELIKMASDHAHTVVEGPRAFNSSTSWQGPSIAVSTSGAIGLAYRYEKENPDPADPDELIRNSRIRLIVSNASRTLHYYVEPSTCASGRCRTINTPMISYDWGAQRWLVAFTENAESDGVIGYMNSLSVLVSDDSTGQTWSRPPLRTGYHSSWAPPALNCDSFWGFGRCLLVYSSWDRADGRMARTYQAVVEVDDSTESGLTLTDGGSFEWGVSSYGHLGLAGSNYGWLMTRLDSAAANYDNISWSHKNWAQGLTGTWTSQGNWTGTQSEKGYSVACNYFALEDEVWCRFVWTLH